MPVWWAKMATLHFSFASFDMTGGPCSYSSNCRGVVPEVWREGRADSGIELATSKD